MSKTLVYVHDPMCSWCWGFEPTRHELFDSLPGEVEVVRLLGGLAPDSDQPMPPEMREYLQQTWRRIEQMIPGTRFNFDFWQQNTPRRSTYPANRAVIAARMQGDGFDQRMTAAIQQAYYLQARNPSDNEILLELCGEIGLDSELFEADLGSDETQNRLIAEISQARALGIEGFPSLAVINDGRLHRIGLDYGDAPAMLREIDAV